MDFVRAVFYLVVVGQHKSQELFCFTKDDWSSGPVTSAHIFASRLKIDFCRGETMIIHFREYGRNGEL